MSTIATPARIGSRDQKPYQNGKAFKGFQILVPGIYSIFEVSNIRGIKV